MKLLIDDADVNEIQRLVNLYPIDGVTTNPSILSKQKKNPKDVLIEIRQVIGEKSLLFVQVLPKNAEGMVEDAKAITQTFGSRTVVKIPTIPEGLKAIRILKQMGICTCGTVVYTPMQGYLAAKAGASYVAPYVNRIDNMGYDGVSVTKEIHDILVKNEMNCEVLAASFKNSQQVLELCKYGIGSATVSPAVIDGFMKNPAIDQAVEDFITDFNKLGDKRMMKEYL